MSKTILRKIKNWCFPNMPVQPFIKIILDDTDATLCDVGAAKWLLPHWQVVEGAVDLYLVEPCQESLNELQTIINTKPNPARYHLLPYALSGQGGERTLYVTNCETGTSIIPIEQQLSPETERYVLPEYFYPVKEQIIETHSFESVINKQIPKGIDFLKLDTQKSELEILSGLSEDKVKGLSSLELEINLFHQENGQSLLEKTIQFSRQHDMILYDLRTARLHLPHKQDRSYYQKEVFNVVENCPYISGHIHEVDAIFFPNQKTLIGNRDKKRIQKLIVAYAVYHFFSEAYALTQEAQSKGILSESESANTKAALKGWFKAKCPRFIYSQGPMARVSRQFLRRLKLDPTLSWARHLWVCPPNA